MTPAEVAAILRQFNEWRRSDYEPSEQPAPPDPREIGEAIDSAIEMIDRLEAAERDRSTFITEIGNLCAKIEAMEQQEPVAWHSKQYGFVYMSRQAHQFEHGTTLYLRNGTPAWRIDGGSKVALLDMALLPHGTVFYALLGA